MGGRVGVPPGPPQDFPRRISPFSPRARRVLAFFSSLVERFKAPFGRPTLRPVFGLTRFAPIFTYILLDGILGMQKRPRSTARALITGKMGVLAHHLPSAPGDWPDLSCRGR